MGEVGDIRNRSEQTDTYIWRKAERWSARPEPAKHAVAFARDGAELDNSGLSELGVNEKGTARERRVQDHTYLKAYK